MANIAGKMVKAISMVGEEKLKNLIAEYEEYFMPNGIQQSFEELAQLVNMIGDRKFHSLCEIGIADGGTLWLYSNLFAEIFAKFTVLDMDIRPITHKVMDAINGELGIDFKIFESKTLGFRFEDKFDFLHIDGDHSYEAVKYDYDTHSANVVSGGIIIIHDTLLIDGPMQLRKEIEESGVNVKTFQGFDTLCTCYGRDLSNPDHKSFGTTVVLK